MWTDATRRKHARKGLRYSSDMTDAEWAVLEPHCPAGSRLGRPRKWTLRQIVDALLYNLRSGLPWRMLPKDFPPVSTSDPSAPTSGVAASWSRTALVQALTGS